MEKHNYVYSNCKRPAIGIIKKMAIDKSWADVEWHVGIGCVYVERSKVKDLKLIVLKGLDI